VTVPNGGWHGSTRRARLPSNWRAVRAEVFETYGDSCHLCGDDATDVDHLLAGDDHSLANLRPICKPCHRVKSSREGGQAAQAAKPKRQRAPERHPGMR
jgi:5-methylcytosine-specific restriction protein A